MNIPLFTDSCGRRITHPALQKITAFLCQKLGVAPTSIITNSQQTAAIAHLLAITPVEARDALADEIAAMQHAVIDEMKASMNPMACKAFETLLEHRMAGRKPSEKSLAHLRALNRQTRKASFETTKTFQDTCGKPISPLMRDMAQFIADELQIDPASLLTKSQLSTANLYLLESIQDDDRLQEVQEQLLQLTKEVNQSLIARMKELGVTELGIEVLTVLLEDMVHQGKVDAERQGRLGQAFMEQLGKGLRAKYADENNEISAENRVKMEADLKEVAQLTA